MPRTRWPNEWRSSGVNWGGWGAVSTYRNETRDRVVQNPQARLGPGPATRPRGADLFLHLRQPLRGRCRVGRPHPRVEQALDHVSGLTDEESDSAASDHRPCHVPRAGQQARSVTDRELPRLASSSRQPRQLARCAASSAMREKRASSRRRSRYASRSNRRGGRARAIRARKHMMMKPASCHGNEAEERRLSRAFERRHPQPGRHGLAIAICALLVFGLSAAALT